MSNHKRLTFRDPYLQEEFSTQGYVIVNLDEADRMKDLAKAYQDIYPEDQEGCLSSIQDPDYQRKRKAENWVRQAIGKKAMGFLDEYRVAIGAFIAKFPGDKSVVPPHIDWTFVDEEKYTAVAVWAPLTEVTSEAGRLYMLNGSHRLPTPLCGSNLSQCIDIPFSDMTELTVEIGQAVFYNLRTIHASPANTASYTRLAGGSLLIPNEADLWHVTLQDGKILTYSVDDEFYTRWCRDETKNIELLSKYKVIHSEPLEPALPENESQRNNSQPFSFLQRVIKRLGIV